MFESIWVSFIGSIGGLLALYTFVYSENERNNHRDFLISKVGKFENLNVDEWGISAIKFAHRQINLLLLKDFFKNRLSKREHIAKPKIILRKRKSPKKRGVPKIYRGVFSPHYWDAYATFSVTFGYTLFSILAKLVLTTDAAQHSAYMTDVWTLNGLAAMMMVGALQRDQKNPGNSPVKNDSESWDVLVFIFIGFGMSIAWKTLANIFLLSKLSSDQGSMNTLKDLGDMMILNVIQIILLFLSLNLTRYLLSLIILNPSIKKTLRLWSYNVMFILLLGTIGYFVSKAILFGLGNLTERLEAVGNLVDNPGTREFELYFLIIYGFPLIPLIITFFLGFMEMILATFNNHIKKVLGILFRYLINRNLVFVGIAAIITYFAYLALDG